ncbi:serine/threonine-protein kinase [Luteolibacter marinus]|uniref:serine/threonine-protein kinase n=1 Tax=Luteolibacter marinus TaxID=2776705 RepID=UPI001D01121B|nr:serine/threonine-protein kinase [Luteolibacter marinus]
MAQAFASRTGGDDPPLQAVPAPEDLAERFPQFEVLECLGRGGMGVVYKARQKALDRLVAIKVLAGEWQGEPGFAERFEREAKTLARMSHPNIVTVHDFGETGGLYYLVMEYVDGVNLRDLLREGKIAPAQALAIVPPICEALQYAHAKQVVHRDIKPENLLLDRSGQVKIADFGIAALAGASGDRSGTPPYMAPEQVAGETDERVDIYALGVVLYEMLTGERPSKELVAPSRKVQLDVRIDEMVMRALEKEPERRYQTIGEFRTMVETVIDGKPGRARGTSWRRGAGILFLILLGIVGFLPPVPAIAVALILPLAILSLVVAVFSFRTSLARGLATVAGVAALFFVMSGAGKGLAKARWGAPGELALSPPALRSANTARVISAGLAAPEEPWAWQELERRRITTAEAGQIFDGLASRLREQDPDGREQPLTWMQGLLEKLQQEGLVADESAAGLVKVVEGKVVLNELPRVREKGRSLTVSGKWGYPWAESLLGLVMMNELLEVTVDGIAVEASKPAEWDSASFVLNVRLPALGTGTHVMEVSARRSLVKETDVKGLPRNAAPADWPRAQESWVEKVSREFLVFGPDQQVVAMTREPGLNPALEGGLSVGDVVVQPDGNGVSLVIPFEPGDLKVPVSFEVTMKAGKQEFPCGTFWIAPDPVGRRVTTSGTEMRVDLDRLDPGVSEVTLVLEPQPDAIAPVASVDRIWGERMILAKVPVRRLDLNKTGPAGGTD